MGGKRFHFRSRADAIAQDPDLQIEQRLRFALFDDIFAESFARDLNEPANSVSARVLAAIAFCASTASGRPGTSDTLTTLWASLCPQRGAYPTD
jgi:hypothetical protein